jgi:adenylosuccinate synthase
MAVQVIIGAQWGDEGKGKLVDFLAENVDLVARYQGGANAGHTVHIKDKKYILHLIPGGILRPNVQCLICNGVVFDPDAFFEELDFLAKNNIHADNRLFISERAHVVFPYHKILDKLKEENLQSKKIGTTGRGIGPAYIDKYSRSGIRVIDLLDEAFFTERLKENIDNKNKILVTIYQQEPLSFADIYDNYRRHAERLHKYVADTTFLLNEARQKSQNILLEGAQGSLLDADFGSYPYVTSSNPTCGGAISGTGLPPSAIKDVIGVVKAYNTRVGEGPFPSEDLDEIGVRLRKIGNEFGATTGRPRRCGWFDMVALKYAVQINGCNALALTKLDVLDQFETIKFCENYEYDNQLLDQFPASMHILDNCKPVFETVPGWQESVTSCRKFENLPQRAQKYVQLIEHQCSVPVKYISVGVERDQIIVR